jgi:hypothetical protein
MTQSAPMRNWSVTVFPAAFQLHGAVIWAMNMSMAILYIYTTFANPASASADAYNGSIY